MRVAGWLGLFIVLTVLLSGCSRRQSEWESARAADSVESYERFLKEFPDGEFSAQAQARAKELSEARDWKAAVSTNTLPAYQAFVTQYPDGRMSDEARIRIEGFTLAGGSPIPVAEEPAEAGSAQSAPVASAPPPKAQSASAPAATPAAAPPAVTSAPAGAGGGYRVQLGAFSGGDKQAMGEWRRLQSEFPQLLQGLSPSVKLATTNAGHLYRLQAGATTEARAREICAKLQDEGRACVVVLP